MMNKAKVLIIDESDLFRDCMKMQLEHAGLDVSFAINGLDGISKMRDLLPDLIIMDYHLTRKTCYELLEEKNKNPNIANIPLILTARKIDRNKLLELVHFNIKKILTKPIKMDILYQVLTEITGMHFEVEKTPCVIESHVNDNIVFIEIAKGLNREKIALLGFKIRELLSLYAIQKPRVLIMLSDMELSFVDGANLEILFETILKSSNAKPRYIKVLSRSVFVHDFVEGQASLKDIEVVSSLDKALDGLVANATNADYDIEKAEIISDKILATHAEKKDDEAIEMRFDEELRATEINTSNPILSENLSIAVVDDDFVIQELLKTTFEAVKANVSTFINGREFITSLRSNVFDLVFLDIRMPEMDGFAVLSEMHAQDISVPVIILSAVSQREAVIRAFNSGVKSYLVKPLKPEQIMKKIIEILKANF